MTLPEFNDEGNLPPGVYRVTLAKRSQTLRPGLVQRSVVADRLSRLYQLAISTGHLGDSLSSARSSPRSLIRMMSMLFC